MRSWYSKALDRLRILTDLRSRSGALIFLRALCFAAMVPLLMRLPTPKLQLQLEPRGHPPVPDPDRVRTVIEGVEAALAFGPPLVRPGCLTRGLTLYRFLREAGLDVELCFGMGTVDDAYEGHCWLTRSGTPYLERVDPRGRFVEVFRIPLAAGP